MPNLFAYGVILLWPLIAILLYKKFDTVTATFWTIVGGYMFLPVKTAIDLPMIPAIGKDEISAIAALIGCIVIKNEKISFFGITKIHKILIGLLLVIPFVNVFFNTEPMYNRELWVPGLSIYDSISQVLAQYLRLLPFIIAVNIVRSVKDLERIIHLLVIAGLGYSVLILFEIRISPQLHTWVYGFFPHSFAQQFRFGGYRAVVFMGHGLLVATFCFVCVGAAAIQLKIGSQKNKAKNLAILAYLLFVLIVSKTVGSIFLGLVTGFSIVFLSLWQQKLVVKILVLIFLLYPTLSILNVVPYDSIISFIRDFSEEKADSLEFRFTHEVTLITHAFEKFLVGWGSWGRNLLHGSIPDGYWVIVYGQYGAIYFYALFGLFIASGISALSSNAVRQNKQIYLGLGLILACVLFDQIPNSSLGSSWLWFLSGVLVTPILKEKNKANA